MPPRDLPSHLRLQLVPRLERLGEAGQETLGLGAPAPPVAVGQAQVEVAESGGERELAAVQARGHAHRVRLQPVERAQNLLPLHLDPVLVAPVLGTVALLVDHQQHGVAHAVGQRLQPLGRAALVAARGKQLVALDAVELLHDRAAVEDGRAVIEDQAGDLAERIGGVQRLRFRPRLGRNVLDLDAEMAGRHADLGGIGGGAGIVQLHGRGPYRGAGTRVGRPVQPRRSTS